MEKRDIASARGSARTIIQRIVHEPDFADQLRSDPRATLVHAGLPDWAIDDFVSYDLGLESDVVGYSMDRCAVTSLLWVEGDGMDPQ